MSVRSLSPLHLLPAFCLYCSSPISSATEAPSGAPIPEADGSVKFSFKAPYARKVELRGQWGAPVPFERTPEGLWTATAVSVPAGIWEYSFAIDGESFADPSNPMIKPMREPRTSILHIPSKSLAPWDWQDVPHGSVHFHQYASATVGSVREVCVYTPPGYESTAGQDYPLLVLQHGSGDNQRTWIDHGKAHWIMDSLFSDNQATPMIVMMIDGHPLGQLKWGKDPAERDNAYAAFQKELLREALPLVEKTYRVKQGAENRALAGLSMGGGQAFWVKFNAPTQFGSVGIFSGAPLEKPLKAQISDVAAINSSTKLFWVACGEKDFLLSRNEEFVRQAKALDLKIEWRKTDGDHSWPVWRRYLAEFAPRLFR